MTKSRLPAYPTFHVRVFIGCLALLFLSLAVVLFVVHLEATVSAPGRIELRGRRAIQAPIAGTVELGWYEVEVSQSDGSTSVARVDASGNGVIHQSGTFEPINIPQSVKPTTLQSTKPSYHALQTSDEIWPGQPLGVIAPTPLAKEIQQLRMQLKNDPITAKSFAEFKQRLDQLEQRWTEPVTIFAPKQTRWSIHSLAVKRDRVIRDGKELLQLVPANGERRFAVKIDIPEKHAGEVQVGQTVYLNAAMYNERLYGKATGVVERIGAVQVVSGKRVVRIWAKIADAPFDLRAGASVEAEIAVGRKPVYRIILEK